MRAVASAQGSTSRISFNACQRRGEHPVMRADVMSEQVGRLFGMRHNHDMGRTGDLRRWRAGNQPAQEFVGAPRGWVARFAHATSVGIFTVVEGISTLHGGSGPHPPPPRNAGSLTA